MNTSSKGPKNLSDSVLINMARAAMAGGSTIDASWPALDLSDPAQREFGDYELLEEIGRGGMGVVYRARQHSLDRDVAIKFISAGAADEVKVARFLAEARAAARLMHPNIVPVYEVGSIEGVHYFSMPLVKGNSLATLLVDEPMPIDDVIALLLKLCGAIDYAHRLGLLHLDLKPANVLLDARNEPLIADFGLARHVDAEGGVDAQEVSGTPAFMAPEQILIKQYRLTPATDLYGLGAILYRCLTGISPHGVGTADELLRRAVAGRILSPRDVNPKIERDLAAVCMKCLELEPKERYASAVLLADDLRNVRAGSPVSVRPIGMLERSQRWVKHVPRSLVYVTTLTLMALGLYWINNRNIAIDSFDPMTMRTRSAAPPTHGGRDADLRKDMLFASLRNESLRSAWAEADQKRFFNLIQGHPCDVLVVPVQNQHSGFDRATRSLMTAQLAHAIAFGGKHCVVDPYLASRALGDGLRQLSRADISNLATAIQANTIVSVYAGHDTHSKMEIEVHVLHSQGGQMQKWNIEFSDEQPPFVAWQSVLPDILKLVGVQNSPSRSSANAAPVFSLPQNPAELIARGDSDPLDRARRFQALASLGPIPEYRATERLYEKSWLTAQDVPDSPESRRIQARALFHLGYRPAALALLAGDDTAEGHLLSALLNGNWPDASRSADGLTTEFEKFLAAVEIRDLGSDYDRVKEKDPLPQPLRDLMARSDEWATLVDARAGERDGWHVSSNFGVKTILDAHYPVAQFDLRDIRDGAGASGKFPSDAESDLLPIRHVNRLLEEQHDKFCCSSFQLGPSDLDFVDLIDAQAQANIENEVNRTLFLQGSPERALALLDGYDAEFSGHPHFSLLRAQTYEKLLKSRATERVTERTQAKQHAARSAAYWEQSVTTYAFRALMILEDRSLSDPFESAYAPDFPPRPFWTITPEATYVKQALNYATDDTTPIGWLIAEGADKKALLAILDTRFAGSPRVASLRGSLSSSQEDANAALARLRAELAKDPDNWSLYDELAKKLVLNSKYAEAAEVVKAYPGFKPNSGKNAVWLSNIAVEIASLLYWQGAIDPATVLFKIAAGYPTGSHSSMLADQRLRGLRGDFAGSIRFALDRMQRYDNPYAAREYLCMLFALGDSREAWPAFTRIVGRFSNAMVWQAAMVGHHVDGASDAAVRAWLKTDSIKNIHAGDDQPALPFALRYFMVDRQMPADLVALMVSIEGPPKNYIDVDGGVMRPHGSSFQHVAQLSFNPNPGPPLKYGDHVPSDLVLFAEAYSAQRRGDHAAAITAFEHLASLYSVDLWEAGYALPYFAMSAAKTGDKSGLKTYLDTRWPSIINKTFGFYLAQAVFAGVAHDHDAAREYLRNAFVRRTTGDNDRVLPSEYEYAEICIWLFKETGEAGYRDLALDWARKYQRLDPTFAWTYALEARFADEHDKRRIRAIAIAEYLDRGSFWLSEVPKRDREAASVWIKSNNPFRKTASARSDI